MLLTTWNVNSLKTRIKKVHELLTIKQPDFLLLQEIKGLDETIFQQFNTLGYTSYYNLQKTYNGVATISKLKGDVLYTELPHFPDEQARYLEIKYGNLHVINVYIPNGNPINTEKYKYKLAWLVHLYQHLRSLLFNDIPFIIAGDFNIAPEDSDVYSVKAFQNDALTEPQVRDIFFKIMNFGLVDAVKIQYSNSEKIYTWWDYRHNAFHKNNGARIDHILLSPYIADSFLSANIDTLPRSAEQPSDHTPVSCLFNSLEAKT